MTDTIAGIIVAGLSTLGICLVINLTWLYWMDFQDWRDKRKKEQNNGKM